MDTGSFSRDGTARPGASGKGKGPGAPSAWRPSSAGGGERSAVPGSCPPRASSRVGAGGVGGAPRRRDPGPPLPAAAAAARLRAPRPRAPAPESLALPSLHRLLRRRRGSLVRAGVLPTQHSQPKRHSRKTGPERPPLAVSSPPPGPGAWAPRTGEPRWESEAGALWRVWLAGCLPL